MTQYLEYRIQLKDTALGKFGSSVISSGGVCYVATAGSPSKQAIVDKTGASLANPLTPTRGFINFFVPDTVLSVDLYIQFPGGQFKVVKGVTASGPNEIGADTSKSEQLYQIPFSIADTAAATETATGFALPDPGAILDRLHGAGIYVTTLESGKTIDVGTAEASAAGGDANGLIAASSLTAAGVILGTNGALFSSNAPATSTALVANRNLVYTLSSASVAAKGFILLPIRLYVAP